jgi:hypothetical protein
MVWSSNSTSISTNPYSVLKCSKSPLCLAVVRRPLKPEFWSDFKEKFSNFYICKMEM